MTTFKHSGCVGDCIASLPTLRELLGGGRGILYLQTDVPAHYARNMRHPCGSVRMSRQMAEKLLPLLQSQQMFEHVAIWNGESVDVNLDEFRRTGFNLAAGHIARYYCHVHAVCPKLWEPWLTVEPDDQYRGSILVNRTSRYHNKAIDYSILTNYSDVRFLGLPDEYREFSEATKLVLPHVCPTTFLDTARAIAGCRLCVVNQSSAFMIADAMKVPRILEICPFCPNVSPVGPHGYEFLNQPTFAELLRKLT